MGVDNMVRMVKSTATPAVINSWRLSMDEQYEKDTEQLQKMKVTTIVEKNKLIIRRANSGM